MGTTDHAYRAPMNIPTDWDAVWMAAAMVMIMAPKRTVYLRPIPSDRYGAKGYAAREPMFCSLC